MEEGEVTSYLDTRDLSDLRAQDNYDLFNFPWPTIQNAVLGCHAYTGPFFLNCDHGCGHGPCSHCHGVQSTGCFNNAQRDFKEAHIRDLCFDAIRRSTLIFAWIDSPDIHGVLRQDPDVVLVGEMRDLETIEAALTIAETGHLVFATLHTNSCVQSINRVIDVFPPHQQPQVRAQLSFVLEGVLTQLLLPRANSAGRVLAVEVMVPNPAIRNLIREDKIHQIYSQMQVGQERHGMQTLNQSLYSLYIRRLITLEEALGRSSEQDELRSMIESKTSLPVAQMRG